MFKAWDWRWLEQGTRTENFHLQGRIFLSFRHKHYEKYFVLSVENIY